MYTIYRIELFLYERDRKYVLCESTYCVKAAVFCSVIEHLSVQSRIAHVLIECITSTYPPCDDDEINESIEVTHVSINKAYRIDATTQSATVATALSLTVYSEYISYRRHDTVCYCCYCSFTNCILRIHIV